MITTPTQLLELLAAPDGARIEFKSANSSLNIWNPLLHTSHSLIPKKS